MKFTEHMNRLIASREAGHGRDIFRYNGKLEGYELAKKLGIAAPTVVLLADELEVMRSWIPRESVVVKPAQGCSSRAVLPLEFNQAPGAPLFRLLWDDVRRPASIGDGEWLPWASWIELASWLEHTFKGTGGEVGPPWIAESMVRRPDGPELSYVWKVYCIHGQPAWCRQLEVVGRTSGKVACWSFSRSGGDWTRLTRDVLTNHPRQQLAHLPEPRNAHRLFKAAQDVAEFILEDTGSPFVRVDMLEGLSGPVFNEITPHPSGGNDRYDGIMDALLGSAWSKGRR